MGWTPGWGHGVEDVLLSVVLDGPTHIGPGLAAQATQSDALGYMMLNVSFLHLLSHLWNVR